MREGNLKSAARPAVHAALFTVAFLFSVNYIVSKLGMRSFAPLTFAFLRVAGSAVVLNLIVPPRGFSRRDWLVIAGLSILAIVLNQSMFLAGLALSNAHVAAILITTVPVFALIVAILLGLERATATKIGGIALACAGALLVVGGEGIGGLTNALAGTLLLLGTCIAYALYLVLSKPVMERLPPARVISLMFAIGTVLLLPLSLRSMLHERWRDYPAGAWFALVFVIAGPTVIAYLLNAWTLRHAESSFVAAYTYLQPVLTTIMAWAFLHETIRPVIALAAGMILAGVALAGRAAGPVPE